MFKYFLTVFLLAGLHSFGADTTTVNCSLKGYKKWFYKIVTLHPRLNSGVERQLLRHYLCGSGTTFLFSDSDFERLKQAVLQRGGGRSGQQTNAAPFCASVIVLDGDSYFDWGLGSITCVFDASCSRLISFADVYDFNSKKPGKRSLKLEVYTRLFRFLSPRSAKPFLVSYGKAAYWSESGNGIIDTQASR